MESVNERSRTKSKKKRRRNSTSVEWLPWKLVSFATLATALAVYYLGWHAPGLVPVPAEVKVPSRQLTDLLEPICSWCGSHHVPLALIGAGLVAAGVVFRLRGSAGGYYTLLTVVSSSVLLLTYLSISAPIDRLIRSFEESIPKDQRVELRQSKPGS